MTKKLSTDKLTYSDMAAISAGLKFLVLESRYDKNLAEGDRVLSVRFSRPVLKRPLTGQMQKFLLEWVKTHPQHWVLEVTAHFDDGNVRYDEIVELEAHAKLDWLTEAHKQAVSDAKGAGNPRHAVGVSWRAWIKTKADRRLRK